MNPQIVRLKYSGTALPADSDVVVMFSTTGCVTASLTVVGAGAPPQNFAPIAGLHTYRYSIENSQIGTVKGYSSNDRGANWYQFYDSGSLSAVSSGATANSATVSVEGLADFRFDWANTGTVTQTVFVVNQDLSAFP